MIVVHSPIGRQEFLQSENARLLRQELEAMVKSPKYNTSARYTPIVIDGSQFVDKHMRYMANHLRMNHQQYISNVKLMTKIRK